MLNLRPSVAGKRYITIAMKTFQLLTGIFLFMTTAILYSCSKDDDTISITGIVLNKTELTLTEGEFESLTATVQPENATNPEINWKSSKPDVANVDNEGKVTALNAGNTIITTTTEEGNFSDNCQVTVKQFNPFVGTWIEPYDPTEEVEIFLMIFRENWTCDQLIYTEKIPFDSPYSEIEYEAENAAYNFDKQKQELNIIFKGDVFSLTTLIKPDNIQLTEQDGDRYNLLKLNKDATADLAPDNVRSYRFTAGTHNDINLIFKSNMSASYMYADYITGTPQCFYQKTSSTTATLQIKFTAEYRLNGGNRGDYVILPKEFKLSLHYTGTNVGYLTGTVYEEEGSVYDINDQYLTNYTGGSYTIAETPFILLETQHYAPKTIGRPTRNSSLSRLPLRNK